MTAVVLDASAVIAGVLKEPGHERLETLEDSAFISAVNLAEARSRLWNLGFSPEDVDTALGIVDAIIADFTGAQARIAGDLRPSTRKAGLSIGDRACLALAMAIGGKAVTADRVWAELGLPVEIEVIR